MLDIFVGNKRENEGFDLELRDATEYAPLRVTTNWSDIEVLSEPKVLLGFKGYSPVLIARVDDKRVPRTLYISAKSIAEPLEEMRLDNAGLFTGLRFKVRKLGNEKTALYELS